MTRYPTRTVICQTCGADLEIQKTTWLGECTQCRRVRWEQTHQTQAQRAATKRRATRLLRILDDLSHD